MATKKSSSKKSAKKGSAKKAAKKTAVKLPTTAAANDCIQKCIIAYKRCIMSGGGITCHIRLVRCTLRCAGVKSSDINKVLKQ